MDLQAEALPEVEEMEETIEIRSSAMFANNSDSKKAIPSVPEK